MNNFELEKLLKVTPVPEPQPEFWEQMPKRITAKLHWDEKRGTAASATTCYFPRLAWALGASAACLIAAFVLFALSNRSRLTSANQVAQAEKCFREIESLFPNQVQALVFDEHGSRMVLAETANVPTSPPLYLKICGPTGCQRVVTFSGQQIQVNGDRCDVFTDGAGNVLLVGKQLVWSSAFVTRGVGPYRIQGRTLGAAS